MRNLIVSDTIRASRDIFWKHIQGIKQYDNRSRYAVIKDIVTPSQSEPTTITTSTDPINSSFTTAQPSLDTLHPSNASSQIVDNNIGTPLPNSSSANISLNV